MDNLDQQMGELEELKKLMDQLESFSTNGNSFDSTNFDSTNFDSLNIKTKFSNSSNNPDPNYSNVGDSGFDLRAFISEPITLKPLERKLIPTGLKFELSPNTELQVRPRSGMALNHGISVLNTPGTVDEGYRGEVGIIAVNLSNEDYTIQNGERIAQGVIMNVLGQSVSELVKTNTLSETERGEDGFGSTGKK
jgi:dUTP pyrophosphatase